MKKRKRLESIVDLADSREKKAIQELSNWQDKKRIEEDKLTQLKTFRDQYSGQFDRNSGEGMSVNQLMDYRAFLAKINKTINDQENLLDGMNKQIGTRKSSCVSAHTDKRRIQKLLDITLQKEIGLRRKREQLENDDFSRRGDKFGRGI